MDVLICTENAYDADFFGNVGSVDLRGITKGQRDRGVYRVSVNCGNRHHKYEQRPRLDRQLFFPSNVNLNHDKGLI